MASHSCSIFASIPRHLRASLLWATMAPFSAHAETWVVTDSSHPTQSGPGVRVIVLDEAERLQSKLSEGLPPNPQQAMAIVQQRLRSPDGARLQRDLAMAQQGATDAWALGITKIPAVVVDRKYVVYGEPNAAIAAQQISRYRETHP